MTPTKCLFEIDLAKIRSNYLLLAAICEVAMVGAVVKANSYGLGTDKISQVLEQEGCQNFFVARIDEGIILRKLLKATTNIFVLDGVFKDNAEEIYHYNLIPVLNYLGQVETWQQFALVREKKLPCLLHINTNMHRLGMPIKELEQLINKPELLLPLDLKYVISHLSASESLTNPYNQQQLEKFKNCLQYFPNVKASLVNSSGIFLGKDYHFDLVRPGVALYGCNPTPYQANPMQNPFKLTAPIIQLQTLPVDSFVGYNMTFQTQRPTVIATLPLGYADGYPRALSNKGEVFINGYQAPIVGVISMDLMTIDVTDLPPELIFIGQRVEVVGDYCTPDKIAAIIGTIGYEILTQLGNRYQKIYR